VKLERGLSMRFRAHKMAYMALVLVDAIVALLSLTYLNANLVRKYGEPILWRAI
jgi:hypothetical protein